MNSPDWEPQEYFVVEWELHNTDSRETYASYLEQFFLDVVNDIDVLVDMWGAYGLAS